MRQLVFWPLAVLFLASTVPCNAQADAPADPGVLLLPFTYEIGQPFALDCKVPRPVDGLDYQWRKNGTLVSELGELSGRADVVRENGTLRLQRSNEGDFGNYTCHVNGNAEADSGWSVGARVTAKMAANVGTVEGQKVKLQCRLIGRPWPAVAWSYRNASGGNATDALAAFGARALVQPWEQGVELVLEGAQRGDAGEVGCEPAGGVAARATLRVKDAYAALWPFLGICAEVFLLCAFILVYERRRTKRDLDDSDTDNHDHDQKKS